MEEKKEWKFSELKTGLGVRGVYSGIPGNPVEKNYIVARLRDGNRHRVYAIECDEKEEVFWNGFKEDWLPDGNLKEANFQLVGIFRPSLKQYKQVRVNLENSRWTQDRTLIGSLKKERANAKRS